MARYKDYSYEQGKLIPITFREQIIPGSFEFALSEIVDNVLDLSVFEGRFSNDETGAPAYDPRSYSRSSSMRIPAASTTAATLLGAVKRT